MRHLRSLAVGCTTAALTVAAPGIASAHSGPPKPIVLSSSVGAPFNLQIDGSRILVADGGRNLVGSVQRNGAIAPVVQNVPGAAGVATRGRWLAYTSTVTNPQTMQNSASGLHVRNPRGHTIYADLTAYEAAHNPDGKVQYGPRSTDPCVVNALGPRYRGLLDSHAYSVASAGNHWVVADAGANDILSVSNSGRVRTVAVLPAQPAVITKSAASAFGLPACTVGVTYDFESVPTDVEVGPGGTLYVTTLPGGPEGPQLGARGAVWRIDPRSGRAHKIAGGFLGATNLALGRHGTIYVAELFGGKISTVRCGRVRTLIDLPGVVSVETSARGTLYAGTLGPDESTPGTIVKIVQGKVHSRVSVH